jgi:hypothetical protein
VIVGYSVKVRSTAAQKAAAAERRCCPMDDGVVGGQGRDAGELRHGGDVLLWVCVAFACLAIGVVAAVGIASARDARAAKAAR